MSLGSERATAGGNLAILPGCAAFLIVIAHVGLGLQLRDVRLRDRARKRRGHLTTAIAIVIAGGVHVRGALVTAGAAKGPPARAARKALERPRSGLWVRRQPLFAGAGAIVGECRTWWRRRRCDAVRPLRQPPCGRNQRRDVAIEARGRARPHELLVLARALAATMDDEVPDVLEGVRGLLVRTLQTIERAGLQPLAPSVPKST